MGAILNTLLLQLQLGVFIAQSIILRDFFARAL